MTPLEEINKNLNTLEKEQNIFNELLKETKRKEEFLNFIESKIEESNIHFRINVIFEKHIQCFTQFLRLYDNRHYFDIDTSKANAALQELFKKDTFYPPKHEFYHAKFFSKFLKKFNDLFQELLMLFRNNKPHFYRLKNTDYRFEHIKSIIQSIEDWHKLELDSPIRLKNNGIAKPLLEFKIYSIEKYHGVYFSNDNKETSSSSNLEKSNSKIDIKSVNRISQDNFNDDSEFINIDKNQILIIKIEEVTKKLHINRPTKIIFEKSRDINFLEDIFSVIIYDIETYQQRFIRESKKYLNRLSASELEKLLLHLIVLDQKIKNIKKVYLFNEPQKEKIFGLLGKTYISILAINKEFI